MSQHVDPGLLPSTPGTGSSEQSWRDCQQQYQKLWKCVYPVLVRVCTMIYARREPRWHSSTTHTVYVSGRLDISTHEGCNV